MGEDTDLYDPGLYINREMSWLEFNRRVLGEAMDASNPLLERVKFLAICYGNMDEFFMIRVPGLLIQAKTGPPVMTPDHIDTKQLMDMISGTAEELVSGYEECWMKLKADLYGQGIRIRKIEDLSPDQRGWISNLYRTRIYPLLTPLALDVSHPFPFISNNSLNVAVRLNDKDETLYARVKVPTGTFPRFIEIPSPENGLDFVLLEDIIKNFMYFLFPGLDVIDSYTFRVTRNADVKVTIDEACDLLVAVEESLGGRESGFPVRMMVEDDMPNEMIDLFARNLKLDPSQVHSFKDTMVLSDLWQIADLNIPSLKERPFTPYTPHELAEETNIFEALKEKDWILYHPYESFNTVVRFVWDAAVDPHVQSIKICLYRIGRDPSIIKALKKAWEKGKTVSVLMELRAKFDETNNIQWARELEAMGVHVVYGPVDLKVHSKLLQVVRLEGDSLVRYTHLSSGNYNIGTSKQYGDISFFTSDEEIGEDVGELFNALTGYFGPRVYRHLLVAPVSLKDSLIKKIDREIGHRRNGSQGRIVMKANGLVDADIIAALYKASMAGVKVELNIRGLCCLRPGVEGISDNIRVTSIVDRFLEHSRIYYFDNGGDPEMLIGSSDLMPRNLMARVEVLFPILDKEMMHLIRENIMEKHLADNVKAKELMPDGSYAPVKRNGKPFRSQEWFIENRGIWHAEQRS